MVDPLALFRSVFDRGPRGGRVPGNPKWRALGLVAPAAVALLVAPIHVRRYRAVYRRHTEIRSPLKHEKMFCLLGDDRDHLDPRRAGADHADAPPREVNAFLRPQPGVVPIAFEALQSWEVRYARQREVTRRHDAEGGLENLTVGGHNLPLIRGLVEGG